MVLVCSDCGVQTLNYMCSACAGSSPVAHKSDLYVDLHNPRCIACTSTKLYQVKASERMEKDLSVVLYRCEECNKHFMVEKETGKVES